MSVWCIFYSVGIFCNWSFFTIRWLKTLYRPIWSLPHWPSPYPCATRITARRVQLSSPLADVNWSFSWFSCGRGFCPSTCPSRCRVVNDNPVSILALEITMWDINWDFWIEAQTFEDEVALACFARGQCHRQGAGHPHRERCRDWHLRVSVYWRPALRWQLHLWLRSHLSHPGLDCCPVRRWPWSPVSDTILHCTSKLKPKFMQRTSPITMHSITGLA